MRVTHQQIADRVGISRDVVTRALHGTQRARISEETRRAIMETAREMGYAPRDRTTHTVALVTVPGNSVNEVEANFLTNASRLLREHGYRLLPVEVGPDDINLIPDLINGKTADGVLFTHWLDGKVAELLPKELPFLICSDEKNIAANMDLICDDLAGTTANVVRHLRENGHERICMLTSAESHDYYARIEKAVERAMEAEGGSRMRCQLVASTAQAGDLDVQLAAAVKGKQGATAVISPDLWRSVPALYALRDRGMRVPEDVSFVSLFDSHFFGRLRPYVTATDAGGENLARRAVARLVQKMQQPETIPCHERVIGKVIERQSVAPCTN